MHIAIFGHSDKRHIIYTMLRMLKFSGRVCLVTNNPVYKQLSMDFEESFTISDVQVVVDQDPDEVDEYHDLSQYDFVIYDCLLSIPSKIDVVVILDHYVIYEQYLDENEIPEVPTFIPKSSPLTNPNYTRLTIPPASLVEADLTAIEESYKLLPIKNNTHSKAMASILSTITKIPASKLLATLKQKGDDIV